MSTGRGSLRRLRGDCRPPGHPTPAGEFNSRVQGRRVLAVIFPKNSHNCLFGHELRKTNGGCSSGCPPIAAGGLTTSTTVPLAAWHPAPGQKSLSKLAARCGRTGACKDVFDTLHWASQRVAPDLSTLSSRLSTLDSRLSKMGFVQNVANWSVKTQVRNSLAMCEIDWKISGFCNLRV